MLSPTTLRQAVLATLHYCDIVHFAPTLPEIEEYLYGWSAPQSVLQDELGFLKEVESRDGYFFLRGRGELVELRKASVRHAQRLWKKTERFAGWLACAPFVRMIGVCNSLAFGNPGPKSDIDLFVVTADRRLSTARLFLKIFTQIFGVRVHHGKTAGRFCLSFFVEKSAMSLASLAHDFDPHLAYMAWTMPPIAGPETYRDFLQVNREWLGQYFHREKNAELGVGPTRPTPRFSRFVQRLLEFPLSFAGDRLEQWCRRLQSQKDEVRKSAASPEASIIMRRDVFKFHEHDTRAKISGEFLRRLQKIILGTSEKLS